MNIYTNGSGEIIDISPGQVFQGSNEASSINFIAPFAPQNGVSAAFILPDGKYTTTYGMTYSGELTGVQTADGKAFHVWSLDLLNAITQKAGIVRVQFYVYAVTMPGVPQKVIATASTQFNVSAGVLPTPPDIPVGDTWQLMLQYYQDNAYRIEKLEQRLQEKTLLDFTVNAETGQGTKFYSDGTTANIQFPSGGEQPTVRTDWLRVINFDSGSFVQVEDGSYELAFGGEQTGFVGNQYLASVDKFESMTYEAGAETRPSERQGFSQLADTFFKGNDGSLLIHGVGTPFDGRLTLLGGSVLSGRIVNDWTYDSNTATATVSFADGAIKSYQLPKPEEAQRQVGAYSVADWQGAAAPYTITIPKATHQKGANPSWRFYDNQIFDVDVDSTGNMTVYTNTKKDMKIIIL